MAKSANLKGRILGGGGKTLRLTRKKKGGFLQMDIKFRFSSQKGYEKDLLAKLDRGILRMTQEVIKTAQQLMRNTSRRAARPTKKMVSRARSYAEQKAMFAAMRRRAGAPSKTGKPPAVQTGSLLKSLYARQITPSNYEVAMANAPYGMLHEHGYEAGKRPFLVPALRAVQQDEAAVARAFKGLL